MDRRNIHEIDFNFTSINIGAITDFDRIEIAEQSEYKFEFERKIESVLCLRCEFWW